MNLITCGQGRTNSKEERESHNLQMRSEDLKSLMRRKNLTNLVMRENITTFMRREDPNNNKVVIP